MKKRIFLYIWLVFLFLLFLFTPKGTTYAASDCKASLEYPRIVKAGEAVKVSVTVPSVERGGFDGIAFKLVLNSINGIYDGYTQYYPNKDTYDSTDTSDYLNGKTGEIEIPASEIMSVSEAGVTKDQKYMIVVYAKYPSSGLVLGQFNSIKETVCDKYFLTVQPSESGNSVEIRPQSQTSLRYSAIPVNPSFIENTPEGNFFNGYSQAAKLDIYGLRSNTVYKACFSKDPQDCVNKKDFDLDNNDNLKTDNTGHLTFFNDTFLCGASKSSLKHSDKLDTNENCDPEKDYFHEGQTYSMSLFLKDIDHEPAITTSFYVRRTFPHVMFSPVFSLDEKGLQEKELSKGSYNLFYKYRQTLQPDKQSEENNWADFEVSNPLTGSIANVVKIGGGVRNNYQITLESVTDKDISIVECVEVINSNIGEYSEAHFQLNFYDYFNSESTTTALPPGNYRLSIKEQIDENDPGYCKGGFEYYKLNLNVNQEGRAIVDGNSIEADPLHIESTLNTAKQFGSLPCTVGINSKGETLYVKDAKTEDQKQEILSSIIDCTQYHTALASFGVEPLEFINSIGVWFFRIGAIATFGILIYAGFLFQTSRGDKEKIGKAREMITAAITGLIFIILSVSILQIIGIDILRIPGFTR